MRRYRGMSLIGLLISMTIVLIMLWMFLSSMGEEISASTGVTDLLNWIIPVM